MNIFDALRESRNRYPIMRPSSLAMIDLPTRSSMSGLALSSALTEIAHLHEGDRVALFLPNRPEFVISYYAAVRLGAIAVSLNVMLKRDEVKYILNDSEAKTLLTSSRLLDQVPV
jgi:acyl-CoA synthetase (AMP-forming)/AMP-acid ligase II